MKCSGIVCSVTFALTDALPKTKKNSARIASACRRADLVVDCFDCGRIGIGPPEINRSSAASDDREPYFALIYINFVARELLL